MHDPARSSHLIGISTFTRICFRGLLAVLAALCMRVPNRAQAPVPPNRRVDTLHVRDFSDRPTVRLYLSNKFNSMVVRSDASFTDLRYRPNANYNMGIGASYRRLTLNLGFPIPFVNNDATEQGRTRYLDAQATLHTERQSSNLFLQVFKGYHITSHVPSRIGWVQSTSYPYRADLVQFNIGLSTLRIVNHTKFSYRATFNQDAWQQRSQGTWLYGGYATCYVLKADSALVPTRLLNEFSSSAGITKGLLADVGPMGGYAHTFVYRKHWFLTVSGAVGVGPSMQRLVVTAGEGVRTLVDVGPGWHTQWRGGVGYNSRYRYVGVLFNQEHVGYLLRAQDRFAWDVGNFRIIIAQRLRDRPKQVDRGLRWFRRNSPVPVPEMK